MAVGTSSEGTSEAVGLTTIQEHLTSAWKTAESDNVTTNPAGMETFFYCILQVTIYST